MLVQRFYRELAVGIAEGRSSMTAPSFGASLWRARSHKRTLNRTFAVFRRAVS